MISGLSHIPGNTVRTDCHCSQVFTQVFLCTGIDFIVIIDYAFIAQQTQLISHVFWKGFVHFSNNPKAINQHIPPELLSQYLQLFSI